MDETEQTRQHNTWAHYCRTERERLNKLDERISCGTAHNHEDSYIDEKGQTRPHTWAHYYAKERERLNKINKRISHPRPDPVNAAQGGKEEKGEEDGRICPK